jgi:TolB-like protein
MGQVSVGGRDVLRAWSNPALLGNSGLRGAVAINGAQAFGGDQAILGAGGRWILTPKWAIGGIFSSWSNSFREVNSLGDETSTELTRQIVEGGIATALQLGWLRTGVALKGIGDNLDGSKETSYGGDVGLMTAFGGLTLGLAGLNLASYSTDAGAMRFLAKDKFALRAGGAFNYQPWRMTLGAEYSAEHDRKGRTGVGIEWWPASCFGTRAGMSALGDRGGSVSFGFSAIFQRIGIDYAISTHVLGLSHRVSLAYAFGGVTQELAVAPAPVVPSSEEAIAVMPVPPDERINVAVSGLEPQNVSAGDAAVVSDLIRSELVKTETCNVVEKQNMEKILTEHAFQQAGCTDQDCAVKLGRILNVRRMIVGSFGRLVDQFFISIRMVDVETGKAVYADTARFASSDEAERAVRDLVAKMMRQVR